jgi:hypothetical protein
VKRGGRGRLARPGLAKESYRALVNPDGAGMQDQVAPLVKQYRQEIARNQPTENALIHRVVREDNDLLPLTEHKGAERRLGQGGLCAGETPMVRGAQAFSRTLGRGTSAYEDVTLS